MFSEKFCSFFKNVICRMTSKNTKSLENIQFLCNFWKTCISSVFSMRKISFSKWFFFKIPQNSNFLGKKILAVCFKAQKCAYGKTVWYKFFVWCQSIPQKFLVMIHKRHRQKIKIFEKCAICVQILHIL